MNLFALSKQFQTHSYQDHCKSCEIKTREVNLSSIGDAYVCLRSRCLEGGITGEQIDEHEGHRVFLRYWPQGFQFSKVRWYLDEFAASDYYKSIGKEYRKGRI